MENIILVCVGVIQLYMATTSFRERRYILSFVYTFITTVAFLPSVNMVFPLANISIGEIYFWLVVYIMIGCLMTMWYVGLVIKHLKVSGGIDTIATIVMWPLVFTSIILGTIEDAVYYLTDDNR